MKQISLMVIGAGARGLGYAQLAAKHPDMYRVVGVAEPIKERREDFARQFEIDPCMCFPDWKEALAQPKCADCVVISTQDQMHYKPAMEAILKGYDILLEKPISYSYEECKEIASCAEEHGAKVLVCHVLRFTPFYKKLKDILDSGKIGEIVSVVHNEDVFDWHQAHSFVRGHWRNSGESSPMILAKCCHDMDLLQWLIGKRCKSVSSYGSLKYFRQENAPEGAPDRCIKGCPAAQSCHFDAVKTYLKNVEDLWLRKTITALQYPSDEEVEKALWEGPYGRCVFYCDNDVVDHQVVSMEFEDEITVAFTMCAFANHGRRTHIMGTKGEIIACLYEEEPSIEVYEFMTRQREMITEFDELDGHDGHGGGDEGIMLDLYEYLNDCYQGKSIPPIRTSCENHGICFAAEKARVQGGSVTVE